MLEKRSDAPPTSLHTPSQMAVPFHMCVTIAALSAAACAPMAVALSVRPPAVSIVASSSRPCAPIMLLTDMCGDAVNSCRATVSSDSLPSGIQST